MGQTNKELREEVNQLKRDIETLKVFIKYPKGAMNMAGCDPYEKVFNLKEEEFKVNDWVIGKSGNIRQIMEVGSWYFRFHKPSSGSFEYGKSNYRHATHQEIEDHLIKQAKEKGFDIGVEVKDDEGGLTKGEIKELFLVTSKNEASKACERYLDKHGVHLAAKYGYSYYSPINQLEIVKDELTFGGYPVKIDGCNIECDGERTDLTTIKKLYEVLKYPITRSTYLNSFYRKKEDILSIGCATGTLKELENIIKKAEQC